MATLNKVTLIGNLTADTELKQTTSGVSVCSFTIAVNRRFAKEGDPQTADFIPVVTWRKDAEFVAKHFKKGTPILICGELQSRSWTDAQGQKKYMQNLPIILLLPKKTNLPLPNFVPLFLFSHLLRSGISVIIP